jgi:excisionase family DNA binding protein
MAMKSETLLTVQEAADRLRVSRAALYDAMAAGKLKYTQKYGKRLLTERSIAMYVPRKYLEKRPKPERE